MEALKPLKSFCIFIILYVNFTSNNGVDAFHRIRAVGASAVEQKYRTAYHFQPPMNWINDPNGPMYYNGIYHFFYQYNPYGPTWGNIVWAHSYSTDLINWIPLEPAITPSEPFDINGAWSGSATILPGNKPVILYTGIDTNNRQVQNVAFPKNLSDPLLREWIKPEYNPVIDPTSSMDRDFRDPTTAWLGKDGLWRVAVGHRINDTGVAELYRSRDFKTWTKANNPLHSVANTGMWECPDFFPVLLKGKNGVDTSVNGNLVKHVLKVSLAAGSADIYSIGKYSPQEDRYVPDKTSADNSSGLRFDYGKFYASKTFYDGKKKRRVLWGWVREADTEMEAIRKGWAGIQAIPRTLWLDSNRKQLVQWPVEELETLRGQVVHLNNASLVPGGLIEVQGITAAQADVEVTFGLPSLEYAEPFDPTWVDAGILCGQKNDSIQGGLGPFGLLTMASQNMEEYTAVFFHVFQTQNKPVVLMCSGGPRSSLGTNFTKPFYGAFVNADVIDGILSLRSLIDTSVVESFAAGGKACIICRVYPTLANGPNTHLFVFNNGTIPVTVNKLDGWSMGKPLMN